MYRLKGNQGYILADVTLGIFIISVALLAISMLFTQALQMEKVASDYTLVTNLAQKQLELLKTRSPAYWAELQLPCTIPWQDDTFPPPAAYEIITYARVQDRHLVQVTVVVNWQERKTDYSIQLVTFFSNIN